MPTNDTLLLFISGGEVNDNRTVAYAAKSSDGSGSLKFQEVPLPEIKVDRNRYFVPNVAYDGTAGEVILAYPDSWQDVAVKRFGKYLLEAASQIFDFKEELKKHTNHPSGIPADGSETDTIYTSVVVCQNVANVVASLAGNALQVIARKGSKGFEMSQLTCPGWSGDDRSCETTSRINVFCPQGGNFTYLYNLRAKERHPRFCVETMSYRHWNQATSDTAVTWTRYELDPPGDWGYVFSQNAMNMLMLYDTVGKEYWLYIFCGVGTKMVYFRVGARIDGSLKSYPKLQPSEWREIEMDWGYNPYMSVIIFADRVWLFSGKAVVYSCPVPSDAKLPADRSGWSRMEGALPAMGGVSAVTVPEGFLDV